MPKKKSSLRIDKSGGVRGNAEDLVEALIEFYEMEFGEPFDRGILDDPTPKMRWAPGHDPKLKKKAKKKAKTSAKRKRLH
jgi:hypothetical protein